MIYRKWLVLGWIATCGLAVSNRSTWAEEASATSAELSVGQASEPSAEQLSPTMRSQVRFTAMSLLTRAGATEFTKYGLVGSDVARSEFASSDVASGEVSGSASVQQVTDRPYVVMVHGFNSTPERCATLLKPIREAGFRCGAFRYPNDQSIAESAKLLSHDLKDFAKQHPGDRVALVTYSMGGLVAREMLENAKLDPGNVTHLIMIAPPTHGSSCAHIVCSGDIWEHGVRGEHKSILDCMYACVEDGLGEARHELKPDSAFLKQLNARPRNPRVQYSILLGTGGPFSPDELELAKRMVRKTAKTNSFVEIIRPALEQSLDDLADAVEPGDGVVSVARGKLDGVEDTLLLGFSHWNVIDHPEQEAVAAVHREVLKRLGNEPAQQAAK